MAFTLGKWEVKNDSEHQSVIVSIADQHGYSLICDLFSRHKEADASLIAAAPDLLAACEAALGILEEPEFGSTSLGDQLRAAIAQAKGEIKP